MRRDPNEFTLSVFGVKLSASGAAALVLSLPVGVVLIGIAWRLVR